MANVSESLGTYAEKQIERLNLGANGRLGTEFVVAYGDVGEGAVRLSDGQGLNTVCRSREEIDRELQEMADWCDEQDGASEPDDADATATPGADPLCGQRMDSADCGEN